MPLTPEDAKSLVVKELLKKSKEKFGFAVVKALPYAAKITPSTALVCLDRKLIEERIRKAKEKVRQEVSPEEREKEMFLQAAAAKALFAEGAKRLKKLEKKHWIDIVLNLNGTDAAFQAIGITGEEDAEKALDRLSESELGRLAWLCTVVEDKAFVSVGISVQQIKKEARKNALAAWKKQQIFESTDKQEKS